MPRTRIPKLTVYAHYGSHGIECFSLHRKEPGSTRTKALARVRPNELVGGIVEVDCFFTKISARAFIDGFIAGCQDSDEFYIDAPKLVRAGKFMVWAVLTWNRDGCREAGDNAAYVGITGPMGDKQILTYHIEAEGRK